jgi:hypothetical protein
MQIQEENKIRIRILNAGRTIKRNISKKKVNGVIKTEAEKTATEKDKLKNNEK